MGVAAVLAIAAAPAVAAPPPSAAPGGLLSAAPAILSPGPPNGTLADGLNGWQVNGREPPELLHPGARIGGNVTLVSPPFTVPAGAQTLAVTLRARGGGGLMVVGARPLDGGPDVELATLDPETAPRAWAVGVAALAGRAVRIVLDPVPALGTSVEVLGLGPVTAPLPGWTLSAGALDRRGPARRGFLAVGDAPLRLSAPRFRPGSGARELLVSVRGDGVIRGVAGRRAAALRATSAWRDLRVPVRGGVAPATLALTATPGPGGLEVRDIGLVRRQVALRGLRSTTSGARRVIRASVGAVGARLAVEARARSGRRLARDRADARGRVELRVPRTAGRVVLVVAGDRTRLGTRVSR